MVVQCDIFFIAIDYWGGTIHCVYNSGWTTPQGWSQVSVKKKNSASPFKFYALSFFSINCKFFLVWKNFQTFFLSKTMNTKILIPPGENFLPPPPPNLGIFLGGREGMCQKQLFKYLCKFVSNFNACTLLFLGFFGNLATFLSEGFFDVSKMFVAFFFCVRVIKLYTIILDVHSFRFSFLFIWPVSFSLVWTFSIPVFWLSKFPIFSIKSWINSFWFYNCLPKKWKFQKLKNTKTPITGRILNYLFLMIIFFNK